MFWIIYSIIIVATLLWIAFAGILFKGNLKKYPLPDELPLISTIVPARNEERNIGRCANGISAQSYKNIEMIFVDDASTDSTPRILRNHSKKDTRTKVVHTDERPSDWNGKQWACHSGYLQSTGDWLCFMDADTYAEPDLLNRTVAFAIAKNIDFLTLQPWYELGGLWERIVLPAILLPLLSFMPPFIVNNPKRKMAMSNGQFILVNRKAYDAINGHEGVKGRMMDDFPLAENIKNANHRLYIVDGSDVMRVRLYTNLKEIWAGGLKTTVEITSGWLASLGLLTANFAIHVLPWGLLLWAFAVDNKVAATAMGVAVGFEVLFFGLMRIVAFRSPPWTSLLHPVGSMVGLLILAEGMVRLIFGLDIKWKDRAVIGGPKIDMKIDLKNTLQRQK